MEPRLRGTQEARDSWRCVACGGGLPDDKSLIVNRGIRGGTTVLRARLACCPECRSTLKRRPRSPRCACAQCGELSLQDCRRGGRCASCLQGIRAGKIRRYIHCCNCGRNRFPWSDAGSISDRRRFFWGSKEISLLDSAGVLFIRTSRCKACMQLGE